MKGYVTRDKNGFVGLCFNKPIKKQTCWWAVGCSYLLTKEDLLEGIEPKWEDAEPIEVNIKIEKL